jgi:hypothetical protein
VAQTWLQIEVELEGGGGIVCDPRPGRLLIVGAEHSFADLAETINTVFARWDRSHLHEFELPDGRLVSYPNEDFDEPRLLDHESLRVTRELVPGDSFVYTFDLGDNWRHRCRVLAKKADPVIAYGRVPDCPVAIWGWGWIPDQYGRTSSEPDGL